jgi:phosphoenolpyruvate carboxykinase (ATP)
MTNTDGQMKILFSTLKEDVAKVINPSEENEPDILELLKGAILENVVFKEGTNEVDLKMFHNTKHKLVIQFTIDNIQPVLL